jgi:hypothetical protein
MDIDAFIFAEYGTGLVKETQREYELLQFGFVAEWQPFRVSVLSRQIYIHQDTSLPMQFFFRPSFMAVVHGHV